MPSITDLQLLVRTTPPNRSSFHIGGTTGKPAKRRPRAILVLKMELTDERGRSTWGVSADRPSFGWLDKRKKYDPDRKLSRLFQLVKDACEVYQEERFESPFQHWRQCSEEVMRRGVAQDHELLSATYASALVERAMIDAFCRLHDLSFFDALKQNRLGFDPDVIARGARLPLPDKPRTTFYIRHTVGLGDPLLEADIKKDERINDGEPESLEVYAKRDGLRYFKVKISGDVTADLERLGRIWSVLAHLDTPVVTLDGNESYTDIDQFAKFVDQLEDKHLGLFQHIAFIEQPLTRKLTHDPSTRAAINRISRSKPLVIDEADGDVGAFASALAIGYQGVSHKNCKGVFKSLINAVRCQRHAAQGAFQTAEDLSVMPLAALHQDFVALSALGISHCERNGHHYSFGLDHLTDKEQALALRHHADLYTRRGDSNFLAIQDGKIHCASLQCPGFGMRFPPQWDALTPLDQWEVLW